MTDTPETAPETGASVIRRTSFVVEDVEATAKFYEDIFGWTRFYDNETPVDRRFPPCAPDGTPAHIIILKAEDPDIGMVGFMEYRGHAPERRVAPERETLGIGDSILIIETKEMDAVHARAKAAGARVTTAPIEWTVTARTGRGKLRLRSFSFFDPNGLYVEVNTRL